MKLTRKMLIVEPKKGGQDCETCPFMQNNVSTCRFGGLNSNIQKAISKKIGLYPYPACYSHSIQLKPEYNGMG